VIYHHEVHEDFIITHFPEVFFARFVVHMNRGEQGSLGTVHTLDLDYARSAQP